MKRPELVLLCCCLALLAMGCAQAGVSIVTCGDGVLDADEGEVCDDGNEVSGDGCSANCLSDETCGNGVVDSAFGETCDDGNTLDGDACPARCGRGECGDGVLDPGEVCDDGNPFTADGCSGDCLSDETCGNGILDIAIGEACDDGNLQDGDGCSAICLLESCGDGQVGPGEVCDDGNEVGGDGCSADCLSDETCGNGVHDVLLGEGCDDGNNENGDSCTATCAIQANCGNGSLDPGEACDDGNNQSNDGCSQYCAVDTPIDIVYLIPFDDMTGGAWGNFCDADPPEYYGCLASQPDPWGPTWMDNAAVAPAMVTIELHTSVNTVPGSDRPIQLNGVSVGVTQLTAADGSCTGGPTGIDTIVLTGGQLNSYNPGGFNEFLLTRNGCDGLSPNPSWGNALVRVTVSY